MVRVDMGGDWDTGKGTECGPGEGNGKQEKRTAGMERVTLVEASRLPVIWKI